VTRASSGAHRSSDRRHQDASRPNGLYNDERGVVLIQVALALVVLLGFCGLVIDYGVLMAARAQAQNAADSGALAGGTALAFDSLVFPDVAETAAQTTAGKNDVWFQAPQITAVVNNDTCLVAGVPPPPDSQYSNCINVSAFRNEQGGNPLPTFFARLFGVNEQGVRAQARAAALRA